MNRLNDAWHKAHRLPRHATREERVAWHVAHRRACACREVPARLRAEVARWIRGRS